MSFLRGVSVSLIIMKNHREPSREPGEGLTFFLITGLFSVLIWRGAITPGWEIVSIGAIPFAGAAIIAFLEVIRAHRAWKERKKLENMANRTTSGRQSDQADRSSG